MGPIANGRWIAYEYAKETPAAAANQIHRLAAYPISV
jgi:hypothetical protein